MSLKEIVNQKFIEAKKARDIYGQAAYELIKERIMKAEKSGQCELPLTDEFITNLIAKEYKEREDVKSYYTPGDMGYEMCVGVMKELEPYLPKQMSEEEVISIIKRIKETEPNLGKVIGLTVKEVGNRFDKSKIATLVKTV